MLSDKKIKELAAEYFEEEVDRRGRVNYSTDTYGLIDFARAIEAECAKVPVKDEPVAFFIVEQWMHYEQASKDTPGAFPVFTRPQPDLTAEVERLKRSAEHWNRLYREKCQEFHDAQANKGQEIIYLIDRIAELEEAAREAQGAFEKHDGNYKLSKASGAVVEAAIAKLDGVLDNAEGKPTPD